jgi:hypothetical protein
MNKDTFLHLHYLVTPLIQKQKIVMRAALSYKDCL